MKLFELLGYQFDFTMDESESVEIQKIEDALQLVPTLVPPALVEKHKNALKERQQLTTNAYRMKKEVKTALKRALESNRYQVAWDDAYCLAHAYDKAVRTLLISKLQDTLLPMKSLKKVLLIKKMLVCVSLIISSIFIYNAFVDKERNPQFLLNNFINLFLIREVLQGLPLIFEMRFPLLTKFLIKTHVQNSATNEVLSAALDAEVQLDENLLHVTPGDLMKDSDSLISILVNKNNNSNMLELDFMKKSTRRIPAAKTAGSIML